MNRRERFDGFQLDYNSAVDQKIHSVPALEFHVFLDNRCRLLPFERNCPQDKFAREALFVCGFQQARSKQFVYLDGSANDDVGEVVVGHGAY